MPWSDQEVDATVDSYFRMFEQQLLGRPYVKAQYNRALVPLLDGRTIGAVERKHSNISHVLDKHGWPFLEGYKPLSNIQGALVPAVIRYLNLRPELEGMIRASLVPSATLGTGTTLGAPVAAPDIPALESRFDPNTAPIQRNYLELHERNAQLGRAGEKAVVDYERMRLAERPDLAARVEHVALSEGDGQGFDIRSFELDGSDRFVEVKTTTLSLSTPFFVSANEVGASKHYQDRYHLYRVFHFGERPQHYQLQGPLDLSLRLVPHTYRAGVMGVSS